MIYKFIQVYGFDLFDKTRINQITSYFSFIKISISLNQHIFKNVSSSTFYQKTRNFVITGI